MKRFSIFLSERAMLAKSLTTNDLVNIENFLDKLYEHIGIELDLHRKHFIERMNQSVKTDTPIYLREVKQLFEKIYKKYKTKLHEFASTKGKHIELVLQDMNKDLNIPVVLTTSEHLGHADMVAKTVRKQKKFDSSNDQLKV